jgi:hypothetical protein
MTRGGLAGQAATRQLSSLGKEHIMTTETALTYQV